MPGVDKNIHKVAEQNWAIKTTVTKAVIHWLVIAGHPHTANTGWNTTFRLGSWCYMNKGTATLLVWPCKLCKSSAHYSKHKTLFSERDCHVGWRVHCKMPELRRISTPVESPLRMDISEKARVLARFFFPSRATSHLAIWTTRWNLT